MVGRGALLWSIRTLLYLIYWLSHVFYIVGHNQWYFILSHYLQVILLIFRINKNFKLIPTHALFLLYVSDFQHTHGKWERDTSQWARLVPTCGVRLVVNYVFMIISIVPTSSMYFSIPAYACSPSNISRLCHISNVISQALLIRFSLMHSTNTFPLSILVPMRRQICDFDQALSNLLLFRLCVEEFMFHSTFLIDNYFIYLSILLISLLVMYDSVTLFTYAFSIFMQARSKGIGYPRYADLEEAWRCCARLCVVCLWCFSFVLYLPHYFVEMLLATTVLM